MRPDAYGWTVEDLPYLPFLYGFSGSAAVEVVKILAIYETGRKFPARYKKWGFWLVRFILALIGGTLAVAYAVTNPVVAFHVGASVSTIVESVARTPPKE